MTLVVFAFSLATLTHKQAYQLLLAGKCVRDCLPQRLGALVSTQAKPHIGLAIARLLPCIQHAGLLIVLLMQQLFALV